jgi:hypothetical protein
VQLPVEERARVSFLATKGEEIHYGPGTRLNFTLTNSVQM